jgi:hypothetical protein
VAVYTSTLPDAPAPTTAFMVVADKTVKLLADTPPNLTIVTSVKFKPLIVTTVPEAAVVGLKEETITGG